MEPSTSTDDDVWASTSLSWYQEDHLPPFLGHGQHPLTRFGVKLGDKILKIRVANRSDLEKKRYFCRTCPYDYFKTVDELKEHCANHKQPLIKRKCTQCDVQYISSRALAIHCRIVHGETLGFKCDICGKQFTKKHYLQLHAKSHEVGDRFYCTKCGHWYRREEELIEHEAFCDKGKVGKYHCSFCNQRLHERSHTGEKPYACGVCGSLFSQPSALTVHSRIHTGDRKYGCRFCGARFVDRQVKRRPRPYCCSSSAARRHEVKLHFTESRIRASAEDQVTPDVACYEEVEGIEDMFVADAL